MLPITRFAPLPSFARHAPGGVTCPAGFAAAGVSAGLKRSGRPDVGVLFSDRPCVSAAMFTGNAAAAAPVLLTRETGACDRLRAVVVNSGNANACTGKQGLGDAARMRLLAAGELRLPVETVAVASTGVIGVPLPMPPIEAGIVAAVAAASPGGGLDFANAIRTTDRKDKQGALALDLRAGEVHLGVACKGAGMISPNMATMLCFVTSDAAVPAAARHDIVHQAVAVSFNRITVDGQESTNDTVIGFANGASGVHLAGADLDDLAAALQSVFVALATTIVADGEGSTKTVRLRVTGAHDDHEAEVVARGVANSPLVKTAFFGRDPNWGRIVQAVGQAIGRLRPGFFSPDIAYEDITVVGKGREVPLSEEQRERLTAIMEEPEIDLHVALNGPGASSTIYFSDLTHDYVTLNAEYTT
jgi:glutamate N-acetyltransferase/amino-acid N-acetyltransferase